MYITRVYHATVIKNMKKRLYLLFVCLFLLTAAQAQNTKPERSQQNEGVVVGMNVVNPMRANAAQQDTLLSQLKAAGVRVIRCGLTTDDKGIGFAKRAAALGISIQLITGPQYPPGAPLRPYQPKEFPSMWAGPLLSSADPSLSKTYYQSLFGKLDTGGIKLAGVEFGNEINWAAFNPDFPLPGEGKILTLHDLYADPEGKKIARGYLQYLKALAALKYVRDRSSLNRNTPIISGGLVGAADGEQLYNNKKEDMVSLSATIEFLRANGLDSLVDAYGIHTYPSAEQPGNAAAAAKRLAHLMSIDLAECRPAGISSGKPAWITEWGFQNTDMSCPPKDAALTLLVREMHDDFAKAAVQGRLVGITYFAWNADPWSMKPDPYSVYRCGTLTQSGREAIKPIKLGK
jgi:hypothetical protein